MSASFFISAPGPAGTGYAATSTSSLAVTNSLSRSFTTQRGLAYAVGARIRATSAGSPTNWMEGVVTSYSATSLVATMDLSNGAGTFADWNINLAGQQGQTGTTGTTGTTGNTGATGAGYTATSTTSLVITNSASRSFTTQSGLAYTVGARIRATSAGDTTKWMEGIVTSYSSTTLAATMDLSNGAGTFADWNINLAGQQGQTGTTGTTGTAGTNGTDGQNGGAVAVEFTFSTTTTNSDPGNGNLRLDNATQNAATAIRADLLDRFGATWTTLIDSLDDSTSTIKGHIRLVKRTDASKWLLFTLTAVDASTGYRNITVSNVASSAASPFSDTDQIVLEFTRIGDKGDTGTAGTNGTNGSPLTFTAVKTANYTAVNNDFVRCNTSGGAFTVTVPTSPAAGWQFGVMLTTEAANQANALTVSAGLGPHDNKLYCQQDYIVYEYDGTSWQTIECYLKPHCASMRLTTAVTTNTATAATKAPLDTEIFDVGGIADPTTNKRFDIRRPGRYLVSSCSAPNTTAGQDKYYAAVIRQNGTTVQSCYGMMSAASGVALPAPVASVVLDCAAADTIEAYFIAENANVGAINSSSVRTTVSEVR